MKRINTIEYVEYSFAAFLGWLVWDVLLNQRFHRVLELWNRKFLNSNRHSIEIDNMTYSAGVPRLPIQEGCQLLHNISHIHDRL